MSLSYLSVLGYVPSADLETLRGPPGRGFKTDANGNYDMQTKKIINLSDPTLNTDAATKSYVDIASELKDGEVITVKIADNAVTAVKIPDNSVPDSKLQTVTTAGKVSNSATTATDANTVSAIVARDVSGNFSAGTITATLSGNATTATDFTGSLAGDVTGTQSATSISNLSGSKLADNSIADSKLQTVSTAGKVSNSATTATDANTASAIVARDVSGNFIAGTITANLVGNVDSAASGTVNIGVSNAQSVNVGTATTTQTVNIGTGSGATTINVGGPGDTVNLGGTVNNVTATNTNITDKVITLNKGGGIDTGFSTGLEVEENAVITGYAQVDGTRNSWVIKAPGTAGIMTLTPGSSNITIDQGSHNPVTLGTTNGLSLNNQELSLAAASGVTTGAITSTDWTNFNNTKTTVDAATSNNTVSTIVKRNASGGFDAGATNHTQIGVGSLSVLNSQLTKATTNLLDSLVLKKGVAYNTDATNTLFQIGLNTSSKDNNRVTTYGFQIRSRAATQDAQFIISSHSAASNSADPYGYSNDLARYTNLLLIEPTQITSNVALITTSLTTPTITTSSGNLSINPTGSDVSFNNKNITNAVINGSLLTANSVPDSKLNTISTAGKVSNSATTATDANTVNAIVARDASGNFTAGTITATLSGNASTTSRLSNVQYTSVDPAAVNFSVSTTSVHPTWATNLGLSITPTGGAGNYLVHFDVQNTKTDADPTYFGISVNGVAPADATLFWNRFRNGTGDDQVYCTASHSAIVNYGGTGSIDIYWAVNSTGTASANSRSMYIMPVA